jgi:hypothetical protein
MSRQYSLAARVREFDQANPGLGPQEAATKLSKQLKREVSPGYVSNIRSADGAKAKPARRKKRKSLTRQLVEKVVARNGEFVLDDIVGTQQLVRRLGGEKVKQLVDVLSS